MLRRLFALTLLPLLMACTVATIQKDGYTIHADNWAYEEKALRKKAAFDMECATDALQLTILDVVKLNGVDNPSQVGVSGCDQKFTYVYSGSGWLANTARTPK